ncbi:hypothetical protein EXM65_15420 [Clostridium botulinum]|uniref:Replication initiator A N-terminal domain-containing protein n=1 Tax=Clostridium botulinum TaxID=1491 RepID=A0A6M0SSA4_CLOBO|nr:hypothetical protein [Clostridium botulinum]
MSKIITVNDINSTKFYQLPKAFFHNPLYMNMRNESKLAYSILRDLLELSIKNDWINDNNEVFVKLSRDKLMQYLNIKGKQKITQIMNELKSKELIVEKQIGVNKCNEIYICIPDELDIIYSDKELLEIQKDTLQTVENTLKFENQTSGGLKIKLQEVRKSNFKRFENQTHTNTNITNTNITNTSSSSNDELILNFNNNICELKKTTKPKFIDFCNKYDSKFINAIIEYSAEINIRSYKGFETIIKSYIDKEIFTVNDFINSIKEYRAEKKEKNNRKQTNYKNSNIKELKFNNFEAREYDYDELEKKLLGWDK